jgi:hypothetical protein
MSLPVVIFAVVSASIFALLIRLLSKPLPEETSLGASKKIEELLPLHTQHFPQVRQSLASADGRYIQRKVSKEALREWNEERRRILQDFLIGLAQDFARLDQLSRIVASLSPRFSRREEAEWIWLSLRFRANYRIVAMRIAAGYPGSMRGLVRLTELVGNLSARAEAAMARLEIVAPGQGVGSNFTA